MCCLKQCAVGVFLLLWTYFHFCWCVPVQNASVLMLSSINLSPSFPVSFKLALVCTSVLLLWPGCHIIKCYFSLNGLFYFEAMGKLDQLPDLNFCSITKGHTSSAYQYKVVCPLSTLCAISSLLDRGFQAASHPGMSASQNVTINIPWKKTPKEWQPCFLQKLKMWSIAMAQPKCFSQSEHHSYCFTEENPWGVTALFSSEAKDVEYSYGTTQVLQPIRTSQLLFHWRKPLRSDSLVFFRS